LAEDLVVKVTGHTSVRDGAISVFGQDLTILDVSTVITGGEPPVTLVTPPLDRVDDEFVGELKRVLLAHPGDVPVHMRVRRRSGVELWALGPEFKVAANDVAFRSEIKMLLGAGGIE
jgi:DNA polymerase-3 subunit alpha